ncbi:MAG: amino acid ABC transporter ATP-binding protein [Clostridia bacterium]|nr:amino acid ABC transporter ATP-binding protein [Clostridia bacterium]
MAYFEIKNFEKSFGETKVLKGINLSIKKGEVLSIIGSSGSGKTTLLRCMNFLETVDSGVMVLDGETLLDSNVKESESILREKRLNFGLVFQSFNLFPQYTVFKNLTLAPTLLLKEKLAEKNNLYKIELKNIKKNKDISADEKEKKIKELSEKILTKKQLQIKFREERENIRKDCNNLLEKIGLTEKASSYPCELSGGQCQRVAIARALALKPKILCFDEPTSALDPELTGEVLKVIKNLKKDNTTMIIVTHEMGFAKGVSDKVIFMANGVVEEEGNPKDVFNNPKSEKLKNFLNNVSDKDGE